MSIMSVNQNTPSGKVQKIASKRNSGPMNRPQSTIEGEGYYAGLMRPEYENELAIPAYRMKLHNLFRQIEKEFELLYQENQNCELFDWGEILVLFFC